MATHDKRGWKLLGMGYRHEYVCERGEISLVEGEGGIELVV
jgi:hypothetical protein